MCYKYETQSLLMEATVECNQAPINDKSESPKPPAVSPIPKPEDPSQKSQSDDAQQSENEPEEAEEELRRKVSGKIRVRTPPPRAHEDEYFKPLKRLCMSSPQSRLQQPSGTLRSFAICDILQHEPSSKPVSPPRFVRPWNSEYEEGESLSPGSSVSGFSDGPTGDEERANSSKTADDNPLDALFQMTSNTFKSLSRPDHGHKQSGMYHSRSQGKKKRKSRTAFTNHQIFELEKRFIYQKYLSPADRDELSQTLGLSNAQVITWFQNRRAKLKRDMEELKKDVHSASLLSDHNAFIKTMTQMGLLKTKTGEHFDFRK